MPLNNLVLAVPPPEEPDEDEDEDEVRSWQPLRLKSKHFKLDMTGIISMESVEQ